MVCVYCSGDTRVANSRLQKRHGTVWRRRACTQCAAIITTVEAPDIATVFVVRHANGQTEPFSRDTLFLSLHAALGHRPSAVADATALTATIIGHLLRQHRSPAIPPAIIARYTHTALRHFDAAAAVSYTAYHPSSPK